MDLSNWINLNPNWLKKQSKKNVKMPLMKEDEVEYSVSYRPVRCPQCKSKNVRCYSSHPPVRYHICRNCGQNFKSVEE